LAFCPINDILSKMRGVSRDWFL